MGCLDKVGGAIIAIIIVIIGIAIGWTEEGISLIIGGIVFGIMTFAVDYESFMSFSDILMESPFVFLIFKFIINAVVSGVIGLFLGFVIAYLSA